VALEEEGVVWAQLFRQLSMVEPLGGLSPEVLASSLFLSWLFSFRRMNQRNPFSQALQRAIPCPFQNRLVPLFSETSGREIF